MSNGPTATPTEDPNVGQQTGTSDSLAQYAGDYVTGMLGKGQAISDMPYQAYMGPLSAGASDVQQQAFTGLANLALPTTSTTFDAATAQSYICLLYTSPSPRDGLLSRMPSSA